MPSPQNPLTKHLNKRSSRAPARVFLQLNLAGGKTAPATIALLPPAPAGEVVEGIDGRRFVAPADWAPILASINAAPLEERFLDFGHASEIDAQDGGYSQAKAEAAAWLNNYRIENGQLVADAEWTPSGKAKVEGGELRFISPALFTASGTDLTIVGIGRPGLTNLPNYPSLQLNSRGECKQLNGSLVAQALQAVLDRIGVSPTQFAALKNISLRTVEDALAAEPIDDDAPDRWRLTDALFDALIHDAPRGAQLNNTHTPEPTPMKALFAKLGLADNATEADAIVAVDKVQLNATEARDLTKFIPRADHDQQVAQLNTQLSDAKGKLAELNAADIEGEVDAAIAAGKVAPANRDLHIEMCNAEGGRERFAQMVENTPAHAITTEPETSGKAPKGGAQLNASEREVCDQLGIAHDDFIKTRDSEAASTD